MCDNKQKAISKVDILIDAIHQLTAAIERSSGVAFAQQLADHNSRRG